MGEFYSEIDGKNLSVRLDVGTNTVDVAVSRYERKEGTVLNVKGAVVGDRYVPITKTGNKLFVNNVLFMYVQDHKEIKNYFVTFMSEDELKNFGPDTDRIIRLRDKNYDLAKELF